MVGLTEERVADDDDDDVVWSISPSTETPRRLFELRASDDVVVVGLPDSPPFTAAGVVRRCPGFRRPNTALNNPQLYLLSGEVSPI